MHRIPTIRPGDYIWPGALVYLSGGQYLVLGDVLLTRGISIATLPVRAVSDEATALELGLVVLDSFDEFRQVEATHPNQMPSLLPELLRLSGQNSSHAFRRNSLHISLRVRNGERVEFGAWESAKGRQAIIGAGVKGSQIDVPLKAEAIGRGVVDTMRLSRLDGLTAEQSMARVRPEPPVQRVPTATGSMFFSGGQYFVVGDVVVEGGERRMTLPIRVLPATASAVDLGQAMLNAFGGFEMVDGESPAGSSDVYSELKALAGFGSDVAFRRETVMVRLHRVDDAVVRLTATLTETKQGSKAGFVNFEDFGELVSAEAAVLGEGMLDTIRLCRLRGFSPEETAAKLLPAG